MSSSFHFCNAVRVGKRLLVFGSAFSLIGCATAPAGPTPIWFGQVSADGQTRDAKVQSWKDMKFTNVVRQHTDFSCGAAALATIFVYAYNKKTDEEQVLTNMFKVADPDIVREKGFSLLDLKRYVEAIGLKGEGYRVEYAALGKLRLPGIVLISVRGYKHFVVLRRVTGDAVFIADPALGNRMMPRRDFEQAWNGVVFVVMGEGFDANSVLFNPPEPLSARRLFDQRSPVQDANPTDFGIVAAYSYVF